ncbi:MAG: hypothetical protein PHW82_10190 [Bacteroidales bacterium]|nr:hypothetical protein [Bacteroidales bacterium]
MNINSNTNVRYMLTKDESRSNALIQILKEHGLGKSKFIKIKGLIEFVTSLAVSTCWLTPACCKYIT